MKEQTAFERIQQRIEEAHVAAKLEKVKFTSEDARITRLHTLGFTASKNVGFLPSSQVRYQLARAELAEAFGVRIITELEIRLICDQFSLEIHAAEHFTQRIPDRNVQEILQFVDRVRAEKLNLGLLTRDMYLIPLGVEGHSRFQVVAPRVMFSEESIELERLRKEDPLVLKRIYRFWPSTKSTHATDYFAVVTAWGVEEMILQNGTNQGN